MGVGDLQQFGLPRQDVGAGDRLHQAGLVVGVLHDCHAEGDGNPFQDQRRRLRHDGVKAGKALLVDAGAALVVGKADHEHLAQPALVRAGEVRVRLDAVDRHNIIRCQRCLVEVDGHPPVRDPDLLHC